MFDRIRQSVVRLTGRLTGPAATADRVNRRLIAGLTGGRRVPTTKQLKHLSRFLSERDRRVLLISLTVMAVGLVAIGAKLYRDHVVLIPQDGGEYTEAIVGTPHYLNPILAASNDPDADITHLVFSGLMRIDKNGQIQPDLAESYVVSEDGKTYTFTLRSGVSWHDGTDFSVEDVVTTYTYIKNPAWRSPYYPRFKNVSVEAVDEKTVRFILAEPFAPFLAMLDVGILPDHLWQGIRPENAARADLNTKPVGTGPFKYKSLIKDKKGTVRSYTLTRNDGYYGKKPYLDNVTLKFYPDFAAATEALIAKRVEGVGFLPAEAREAADRARTARLYDLRLTQTVALFLNAANNPALKDKGVRQALNHAVNRETVLKAAPHSTVATGPIPSDTFGHKSDVKRYAHDLAKAGALLDQAGWKLDTDGVRKHTSVNEKKETVQTPLAVKILTVDAAELAAVAEAVKTAWEELGVKVEIEKISANSLQRDRLKGRHYEALLYGMIIGAEADPYPFWHSSQATAGLNLAGFSNRRADELLEKGRAATDPAARATLYGEFQDIVAEESPAIFLYTPAYTYAVSRKVRGVEANRVYSPSDRFANVTEWYVNVEREWK